jgi:hypothetical protein
VSFIKRLGIGKPKSDPEHPRATSGGASGALKYVLNPTLVPPEPVDYGGHRGEVETFIASLALMNPDEVAMVHKQGLASGAHMSPRWAEVEGHVVAAATRFERLRSGPGPRRQSVGGHRFLRRRVGRSARAPRLSAHGDQGHRIRTMAGRASGSGLAGRKVSSEMPVGQGAAARTIGPPEDPIGHRHIQATVTS